MCHPSGAYPSFSIAVIVVENVLKGEVVKQDLLVDDSRKSFPCPCGNQHPINVSILMQLPDERAAALGILSVMMISLNDLPLSSAPSTDPFGILAFLLDCCSTFDDPFRPCETARGFRSHQLCSICTCYKQK